MTRVSTAPVHRRKSLPDDACPTCGTGMDNSTADLPAIVNGETVQVAGVSHLACPSCREVVLPYEASRALQEQAVDVYRRSHDLLGAEDIRALRQRLGMTQVDFAALLHLGMNTLSRWESGRNVQSTAMDMLLRVVRDVPGTLDYLKKLAA